MSQLFLQLLVGFCGGGGWGFSVVLDRITIKMYQGKFPTVELITGKNVILPWWTSHLSREIASSNHCCDFQVYFRLPFLFGNFYDMHSLFVFQTTE